MKSQQQSRDLCGRDCFTPCRWITVSSGTDAQTSVRRPGWREKIAAALIVCASACTDDPQRPVAPVETRGAQQVAAINPAQFVSLDDHFARIDSLVGGFGGFFADSLGRRVVLLTDPSKGNQAVTALQTTFTRDAASFDAAVVRRVKYGFRQLVAWRNRLASTKVDPSKVTMIDIDEVRNKLFIGARDTATVSFVRLGLESRGVPADAFDVEVVQPPRPGAGTGPTVNDTVNPIMGGLQGDLCTWAFNVRFNYVMYVATNAHCSASMFQVDGQRRYQPETTYKSPPLTESYLFMGAEEIDPPPRTNAEAGPACGTYAYCRLADFAFYRYTNTQRQQALGKIARTTYSGAYPNYGSKVLTASPWQIVAESDQTYHYVGQVVHKMGAVSGLTHGPITRTCYTSAAIDYYQGSQVGLICQFDANFTFIAGDSGSPVFLILDAQNGYVELVGIAWSVVFSTISGVRVDLSPYWQWAVM